MVSFFSFFLPFDNLKKLEKYSLATESGHEPLELLAKFLCT
jgi:hypothetical protein